MRTNENPVEHETKAAFITHKLRELGYVEEEDFKVQMMWNPPNRQVVNFVSERIPENVSHISIFQYFKWLAIKMTMFKNTILSENLLVRN